MEHGQFRNLICLPKRLAKCAENDFRDHKLIWTRSLELHRVGIMHKLAEHWTGTCRNVLTSPGCLALWGGSVLCRVEWRAGEAADVIRLHPVCLWLRGNYRKPIWIHLRLVNAVLSIQWSVGTKSLKRRGKSCPGCKHTWALTMCSNISFLDLLYLSCGKEK